MGVRVIKRRRVGVLPRQPFTVKRVEEKVGVRVGVGVKARMEVGVGVGKRGGGSVKYSLCVGVNAKRRRHVGFPR